MTRIKSCDLCTCAHQCAVHHKSESAKVSPSVAGKLSKTKTDCALCYCTQFKVARRTLSKPSTAATLTKIPGGTLYRRSGLGRKLSARDGDTQTLIRHAVENGRSTT